MSKKVFMVILCLLCFTVYGYDRSSAVLENPLGNNIRIGRQYFFLIGINKYQSWPDLANPADDVRAVKSILEKYYFYDKIIELYDDEATKENIVTQFMELYEQLTVHDSLFIMYAGHGYFDRQSQSGFWIPSNAGINKVEQANWLSNNQIRGLIGNIEAAHLCLISDSCFAGEILNIDRGLEIPNPSDIPYYARTYPRTSRQVITSGNLETVPDESEFAFQLKMALKKHTQPFLDPMTLYNEIKLGVSESTPLFGNIKGVGHQEGANFLLFRKTLYGAVRVTCGAKGELFIDDGFYDDVDEGSFFIENLYPREYRITVSFSSGETEEKRVLVEEEKTVSITFLPQQDIPSELPEIVPDSSIGYTSEKQRPFSIAFTGAYGKPGPDNMTEYIGPTLYADLCASFSFLSMNLISLSVLLGGNIAIHSQTDGTTEDVLMLYSGILGGLGISCCMPFYSPLALSFVLFGGTGYTYLDSKWYETTDDAWAFTFAVQFDVKHNFGKSFFIMTKVLYMVEMYSPDPEKWLHEINGGAGFGIRL